jgi:two-component system sensor histidine kinase YcbA
MNKNINYIEDTMTDAYMLYNDFDDQTVENKKMKALSIAKNIHEIKKNYISILKGLEVLNLKKEDYNQMNLVRLLNILKDNISKNIDKNIQLKIHIGDDLVINKHYYLMSILRNLINNSIDAIAKKGPQHNGIIDIRYHIEKEELVIEVFDNGEGIKEKYIHYIFNSGYSSKFTKKGEIHRGLGLTLVKEIIENEFNGAIDVESTYNKYTLFKITLDIKALEGGSNEILYIR